jgi:hypothetical protein
MEGHAFAALSVWPEGVEQEQKDSIDVGVSPLLSTITCSELSLTLVQILLCCFCLLQ